MTATAKTERLPAMPPPWPIYRFTAAQYHGLMRIGVLSRDEGVELVEGCVVPKLPRGPTHDACLRRARDCLRKALPPEWLVTTGSTITTRWSELEPDLWLLAGLESRYASRHPASGDVAAVVEIADASLSFDREVKRRSMPRRVYPRTGSSIWSTGRSRSSLSRRKAAAVTPAEKSSAPATTCRCVSGPKPGSSP